MLDTIRQQKQTRVPSFTHLLNNQETRQEPFLISQTIISPRIYVVTIISISTVTLQIITSQLITPVVRLSKRLMSFFPIVSCVDFDIVFMWSYAKEKLSWACSVYSRGKKHSKRIPLRMLETTRSSIALLSY